MKKVVFLLAVGTLSMPGYARAQDETGAYAWENSTVLSFVSTGGNASSSTLGLKSTLIATGGPSTFKIEIGGIRGETTFRTRTATGSATDFTVAETTRSELTAENYFARGRYDRAFASTFAFSGGRACQTAHNGGWRVRISRGVLRLLARSASSVAVAGVRWCRSRP